MSNRLPTKDEIMRVLLESNESELAAFNLGLLERIEKLEKDDGTYGQIQNLEKNLDVLDNDRIRIAEIISILMERIKTFKEDDKEWKNTAREFLLRLEENIKNIDGRVKKIEICFKDVLQSGTTIRISEEKINATKPHLCPVCKAKNDGSCLTCKGTGVVWG